MVKVRALFLRSLGNITLMAILGSKEKNEWFPMLNDSEQSVSVIFPFTYFIVFSLISLYIYILIKTLYNFEFPKNPVEIRVVKKSVRFVERNP